MGTGGLFLRKVRATVADQPTGFVWIEDKSLAGSGYPASRKQLEWIRNQGISSVLTLTEKALPKDLTEGIPMTFDHVSMKDHGAPSYEQLTEAVVLIERRIGEGKTVMVHCLAGEGRTGCVLAAYLIKRDGLSADQALERIREAKSSFVEWSQEKSLYDYAKPVDSGKSAAGGC